MRRRKKVPKTVRHQNYHVRAQAQRSSEPDEQVSILSHERTDPEYTFNAYLRDFDLDHAWDHATGSGIRVAILDTGIDRDHPEFVGAIADTIDFTGEGLEDGNGHGTHMAGIVGARENTETIIGVAKECDLLIAKVLGNDGTGTVGDLQEGILWAMDKKANVILMALTMDDEHRGLHHVAHAAALHGIPCIAPAGNNGNIQAHNHGFPGSYRSVITVGATEGGGTPLPSSSGGDAVDFCAIGDDVNSAYTAGTYQQLSGTSVASAWVAGVTALLLDFHVRQGDTAPITTTTAILSELMKMASNPSHHDHRRGMGMLWPATYFENY